jgi:uncharacterized membrane protein YvbJ
MGRNTSCDQYCENTINLAYQKFIRQNIKGKPNRDISLFKKREIIITVITVVSVIVFILFYVTVISSNQTNAIYLFNLLQHF